MKQRKMLGIALAGFLAGAVTGLFGAGGGMVLVPLLSLLAGMEETEIFPSSISIILPICVVSLICTAIFQPIDISGAPPYLFGSAAGGLLAGLYGKKIPAKWLHRGLGVLILWGGIRYLC